MPRRKIMRGKGEQGRAVFWSLLCLCLKPTGVLAQAEPLGGGQLLGAGRLWVSPAAELDPRAVRVHMEGRGLPAEAIITRYLPKVPAARCRLKHLFGFASAAARRSLN